MPVFHLVVFVFILFLCLKHNSLSLSFCLTAYDLSTGYRVLDPCASGVCPLVGKVGPGAGACFLIGGTDAFPLMDGAVSCPYGDQILVKGCV